ncbi:hypothetical protein AAH446_16225 [Erwinia sp. P6884]|uniref:hypothetical protein n=1 Tax=Erwinia sp. P6884 TaxID=3141450 RepID=UPI00319235C7
MSWIKPDDQLPSYGLDCHVVRKHRDGSLHTTTAKRNSREPLTISEDASINCWWFNTSGRDSYFSDSTVVAWQEIIIKAPAYNGEFLPVEPIEIDEPEWGEDS